MKKFSYFVLLCVLAVSTSAYPQAQTNAQAHNLFVKAQAGCQKPIGFFPTPSKIWCALTAFGLTEKDMKSKALAMVFNVCHGRTLQPVPAGLKPKAYGTLGECLSDPNAIKIINNELTAGGYPTVKVVNPAVLSPAENRTPNNLKTSS